MRKEAAELKKEGVRLSQMDQEMVVTRGKLSTFTLEKNVLRAVCVILVAVLVFMG